MKIHESTIKQHEIYQKINSQYTVELKVSRRARSITIEPAKSPASS